MIKKTILFFLIILIAYTIIVMALKPKMQVSQHQWEDNVITAQNYLYNNNNFENVIIGSSLACRIITDSLQKFYNLSFNGQSIFDGLEVLSYKDKLPKNLFIEMNVVLKQENKNFTSSLSNPFLFNLRKYVPSLRDGKQPLGVLGVPATYLTKSILEPVKSSFISGKNTFDNESKHDALFQHLIKRKIELYSVSPSKISIENSFKNLKSYIELFEQKGVSIIFFEMPVNNSINHLPATDIIRETFYKNFPFDKYHYIIQPDCKEYKTTDGIHLNQEESIKYTNYFKNKIACRYCK